ncbi:hypothetical protein J6590_070608 [Homalodisca vitripennis]|nr:hypothetical protein J6590_070608 [Homalodisca vitripennis]
MISVLIALDESKEVPPRASLQGSGGSPSITPKKLDFRRDARHVHYRPSSPQRPYMGGYLMGYIRYLDIQLERKGLIMSVNKEKECEKERYCKVTWWTHNIESTCTVNNADPGVLLLKLLHDPYSLLLKLFPIENRKISECSPVSIVSSNTWWWWRGVGGGCTISLLRYRCGAGENGVNSFSAPWTWHSLGILDIVRERVPIRQSWTVFKLLESDG